MNKNKTESEWINTVLKKGTIADKLAAHTLLIHESNNWASLDALIEMVDPRKCRRQCVMAMTTLKELFLDSLNISKSNNAIKTDDDKSKIRFYYTKFINQLNLVAFDNLEETRKKAIWVLSELLTKHSDNKEYILEKLVEKMGDKVPKIATTAGHLIEKAINSERDEIRIKAIKYIQRFLKKSNQSLKARYYALALLSRIKLVRNNFDMGNLLMETYLELYVTLTKDKKIESKLMSVILVGIHRAYPYSKLKNDTFEQHLQTLYTLVHQVNFRMSVVAMVLIKNIVTTRAELLKTPIEDRFYNLIYGQLLRPELQSCSRQDAFASLVLNVVNSDQVLERKEAFVKRILLVALNSQPEFAQTLLAIIPKIKGFNLDLTAESKDEETGIKKEKEAKKRVVPEDDQDESSDEGETGPSWVHKKRKISNKSDPLARDARGGRADHLFELYLLRQYCHPEVVKLADIITEQKAESVTKPISVSKSENSLMVQ